MVVHHEDRLERLEDRLGPPAPSPGGAACARGPGSDASGSDVGRRFRARPGTHRRARRSEAKRHSASFHHRCQRPSHQAGSARIGRFLRKLLKCYTFEQMRIPLAVVAPDVVTGEAVIFRDRGDVVLPLRASCSYPGLFQPVRCGERLLVDGVLGATHVISLHLPMQGAAATPTNMFHVINRCFQILHSRTEITWRQHSDLVIEPDVRGMEWDSFDSARAIDSGRRRGCPQGSAAHSGVDRSPAELSSQAKACATCASQAKACGTCYAIFKICLTVPLSFWILVCSIISA